MDNKISKTSPAPEHVSDCAVHNMPAMPNGPCDCKVAAEQPTIPAEFDVRTILLDVVPGIDGMGEEVYAKSVGDVIDRLTTLGRQVEDLQLAIPTASPAQEAPQASELPPPYGYLCDWGNSSYGLTRQTFYYVEPGSASLDDWNESPKVHKNLPLYTEEQVRTAIASAGAGMRVSFVGINPIDPTATAALPMILDSWRYKFVKTGDGSLSFQFHDNGDFVAWKAVEPLLSVGAADKLDAPEGACKSKYSRNRKSVTLTFRTAEQAVAFQDRIFNAWKRPAALREQGSGKV